MSVNYNELLYNKLNDEYELFISQMKFLSPERVIEYAYEITIKKEILSCCEFSERSQTDAKALYELKYPLHELYEEWLSNDFSFSDVINDTIDAKIIPQ